MAFLRAVIWCSGTRKFGISIYNLHSSKSSRIKVRLPLQNYDQIALKSSVASAFQNSTEKTSTASLGSRRDPLDTKFADPVAAFKSKTTWEVLRAYIVYTICSSSYLVENNMKVRLTL